MTDLVYLLDNLVDKDGRIVVPGMYDDVSHLSSAEAKLYEDIGLSAYHISLHLTSNSISVIYSLS